MVVNYDIYNYDQRRKRESEIDIEEHYWRSMIPGHYWYRGHSTPEEEAFAWKRVGALCQERDKLYAKDQQQGTDPFVIAAITNAVLDQMSRKGCKTFKELVDSIGDKQCQLVV